MKTLLIRDSQNNYREYRVDFYPNGVEVPAYKSGKPFVTFYDMSRRETFGTDEQFISERRLNSVIRHNGDLVLYSGNGVAWTIHGEVLAAIKAWLLEVARQ